MTKYWTREPKKQKTIRPNSYVWTKYLAQFSFSQFRPVSVVPYPCHTSQHPLEYKLFTWNLNKILTKLCLCMLFRYHIWIVDTFVNYFVDKTQNDDLNFWISKCPLFGFIHCSDTVCTQKYVRQFPVNKSLAISINFP